jgi:hypothetical protein
MQTQVNENALRVAQNIWDKEGPLAFYKVDTIFVCCLHTLIILLKVYKTLYCRTDKIEGTLAPLLGVGACVGLNPHPLEQGI